MRCCMPLAVVALLLLTTQASGYPRHLAQAPDAASAPSGALKWQRQSM